MRSTLEKSQNLFFLSLLLATSCAPQPPEKVEPKKVYLPDPGSCPDAFPGENVQVTTGMGESNAPVIAWTGEAFALAWRDLRGTQPEVRYLNVGATGEPDREAVRIPSKGAALNPQLAFDGEYLELVYRDGNKVMGVWPEALGDKKTEAPRVISLSGDSPAAGPFGAAVWVNGPNLLFRCEGMLQPEDPEGEGASAVIVGSGGIEHPRIAFGGESYAVVWSSPVEGGREIRMQRVSLDGTLLGPNIKVSGTAGVSQSPVVVWSGKEFAVAWTNADGGKDGNSERYRMFIALVQEGRDAPRLTRQLAFRGSASQVALASTGEEFVLVWVGTKAPRGSAVFLHRVSSDGQAVGETLEITDGVPLACGRPAVAWDGKGLGVVWHDDRSESGAEVFFSYVHCGEE